MSEVEREKLKPMPIKRKVYRCAWCGGETDPAVGNFTDADGAPLCEVCWDLAPTQETDDGE